MKGDELCRNRMEFLQRVLAGSCFSAPFQLTEDLSRCEEGKGYQSM